MTINLVPSLIEATLNDYPTLQNMSRFYIYDLSRYCGFISKDWDCPSDGLYDGDCINLNLYFTEKSRKAFLIKIDQELAGFVLLDRQDNTWNIGEFFILAKFQGKKIGQQVANQLWEKFPGLWELTIIPENNPALAFWRRITSEYSVRNYTEEIKIVEYDQYQPNRYILSFHV